VNGLLSSHIRCIETESNIKNSPSLYLINDICNPKKDLNLKESENADENEGEKIYFLPKKKHT